MFSARSEFLLGLLAAVVTVCIGTMVGGGGRLLWRVDRHAADAAGRHHDHDAGDQHP